MTASNSVGALRKIVETEGDPKALIVKSVGDLSKTQVMRCQVLVGMHPGTKYHPGTTILRTDKDVMEGRFQGTTFLVLKIGPGAFVDAPGAAFYGVKAKIGDWVMARPSDGLELFINSYSCRLYEDVNIQMIVDDPSRFW